MPNRTDRARRHSVPRNGRPDRCADGCSAIDRAPSHCSRRGTAFGEQRTLARVFCSYLEGGREFGRCAPNRRHQTGDTREQNDWPQLHIHKSNSQFCLQLFFRCITSLATVAHVSLETRCTDTELRRAHTHHRAYSRHRPRTLTDRRPNRPFFSCCCR